MLFWHLQLRTKNTTYVRILMANTVVKAVGSAGPASRFKNKKNLQNTQQSELADTLS